MKTQILFLIMFLFAGSATVKAQTTIYVDVNVSGANDGTSWSDTCTDLLDTLDAASNGDKIWVAEGVYKPSTPAD